MFKFKDLRVGDIVWVENCLGGMVIPGAIGTIEMISPEKPITHIYYVFVSFTKAEIERYGSTFPVETLHTGKYNGGSVIDHDGGFWGCDTDSLTLLYRPFPSEFDTNIESNLSPHTSIPPKSRKFATILLSRTNGKLTLKVVPSKLMKEIALPHKSSERKAVEILLTVLKRGICMSNAQEVCDLFTVLQSGGKYILPGSYSRNNIQAFCECLHKICTVICIEYGNNLTIKERWAVLREKIK